MFAAILDFALSQQLASARSNRLLAKVEESKRGKKIDVKSRKNVKTFVPNLEKYVKNIAEECFGVPFLKTRPAFLKNPFTGYRLELDCFNEELKLAIEIQGRQHSRYVPHFHRTPQTYEDQLVRDHIKRQLCKKHGITLICVPFNIRRSEIQQHLLQEFAQARLPFVSASPSAGGSIDAGTR